MKLKSSKHSGSLRAKPKAQKKRSTFASARSSQPHDSTRAFKPHKYQEAAIKFGVSRAAAGWFLDPGLGKTMIAYCTFDVLRTAGIVKRMLVVSVLRPARKTWPGEIEKWKLPFSCAVLHGPKKAELLRKGADVYIINYDGLPWLEEIINREFKGKPPFDMVVFDESSKLRNTNTARFKLVRRILKWFKRRYIATGSPTPKSLMNLFGQIYTLDAGERLGKYITHYRNQYFIGTPIGVGGPMMWDLKDGAAEKIYDKISDVVIRFGEEELDMPKLVFNDIRVELPPSARTIYDDIKRDLIAAVDANIVIAKNAAVATQKLRQIANGGLYLGDDSGPKRACKQLHDAKTEALVDLIEELDGQPLLVGYEFHHDRDRILAALGKAPYIDGTVPARVTDQIIDAWNAGDIPVLLGQITSFAHGINAQDAGSHVAFYSFVWDFEAYDQYYRRVYRQGQRSKRVHVHRIIAENTIDEAVLASMNTKGATQTSLFNALKAHLKKEV